MNSDCVVFAEASEAMPVLLFLLFLRVRRGREFRSMTLRALYNHVLDSITATKAEYHSQELAALRASALENNASRSVRNTFLPDQPDLSPRNPRETTSCENEPAIKPTYRERLGGYLHPRDMRRLITPFSASNEPELIVRRHVVLLNFDPLRAIVLRDRLLVLVPDGADSILIDLEARVKGGMAELEKSVFGDESTHIETDNSEVTAALSNNKKNWSSDFLHKLSGGSKDNSDTKAKALAQIDELDDLQDDMDEFNELNERKWIDLPFELQCVDAVLQSVVALLAEDVSELQTHAFVIVEDLLDKNHSSSQGDSAQETLRRLKNAVGEMEARVQGFIRAMNLLLDEDEDLALMNLSRLITHPERFIQPVSLEILHEESDEPELILEAFLQQGLSTANALELLKGIIGTTNELVSQKLDSVRNRLLYVNTVVSLLSLCVGVASLVGSYFGMNLTNHLEEDPNAFKQVVSGTTAGVFALASVAFWTFWKLGALPKNI